jgi:homoserine dehydrogenase
VTASHVPSRGGAPAPPTSPTIVLKLGSSVLRGEGDLPLAVHEIYRWWRQGFRVIAVVSAFAGVTDGILKERLRRSSELAEEQNRRRAKLPPLEPPADSPQASALAILLAAGERRVAGLLALELERSGVPAQVLDPAGIGLETRNSGLEADPSGLDRRRVEKALASCPVAVLPGFQAVNRHGVASLLGRGGSDLTAIFVAQRLGGRCRLLKDVPGILDLDSDTAGAAPRRYTTISWEQAAAVGGGVVQARALAFARTRRFPFELAAPGEEAATAIGPFSEAPVDCTETPPLRVALLGLGTVGQAVYRRLAALPERFTVAGVAVRHPERPRPGVPAGLVTGDAWDLLEEPVDVVVEALPGVEPAAPLLARALALCRHVVSANKAALAARPELWETARGRGLFLAASAAVGGAVPVLETAARLGGEGRLLALEGVLNGTCNFVLDGLEAGCSLEEAVAETRRRGLAEAEPTADLDGSDAACKLALLARAAFGADLDPREIPRDGCRGLDPEAVREAARVGRRVRQVARLAVSQGRLRARVSVESLPQDHFLAAARGEENRVLFEVREGPPVALAGKGAGGRPTAEAVVADLFDLWRLWARRRDAASGAELESPRCPAGTTPEGDGLGALAGNQVAAPEALPRPEEAAP